jgi:uncharacterized membrane protein affecting hemolysin expression
MGRAMAGVAIVAIFAVTVLLLAWLHGRQVRARALRVEADQLAVTVAQIRAELQTQTLAGYFDPAPIQSILDDLTERELNS